MRELLSEKSHWNNSVERTFEEDSHRKHTEGKSRNRRSTAKDKSQEIFREIFENSALENVNKELKKAKRSRKRLYADKENM